MNKPLDERQLGELQRFLNEKLGERPRIQLIRDMEGDGRTLYFARDTKTFEIEVKGEVVQSLGGVGLEQAVRTFESTPDSLERIQKRADRRAEAIRQIKQVLSTHAAPAHRRQHRDSTPDVQKLVEQDIQKWYTILDSLA